MDIHRQETFYRAVLGAGLIAGLRSLSAPAAVSAALAGQVGLAAQAAPVLRLLAIGEMLVDKLPGVPDRTSSPALAGRVIIGALAGTVLAAAYGRNLVVGATLAGATAALSSYVGLALRKAATDGLNLPDPLVAVAEDLLVVGAGRALA